MRNNAPTGCIVGSVVVPGAPLPANSFVHSLAGVVGITVTDAMQATFLFRWGVGVGVGVCLFVCFCVYARVCMRVFVCVFVCA